jgi:chromate transporter
MTAENTSSGAQVAPDYTLPRLLRYFLSLGTVGFGGPIALAGYMQRDLVEKSRWITPEEYVEGLALAQLAPGPLAAQLAMYLGYVRGGILGATLVGFAFIGPSFVMVLAIAEAYVRYGGLPWMQALFYGIGAAVIGIIARSAWKLVRVTVGKDPLQWIIFLVLGISTAATEREIIWLFLCGGILSLVVKAFPRQLLKPSLPMFVLAGTGTTLVPNRLTDVFLFFAKAGLFVFGSGLAIVPFLHGGVVIERHWLNERQFVDAIAVAMITPGPVVITVAFIGFLVANIWGGIAAALGVFLPVYLIIILLGPYGGRRFKSSLPDQSFQPVARRAVRLSGIGPGGLARDVAENDASRHSSPQRSVYRIIYSAICKVGFAC